MSLQVGAVAPPLLELEVAPLLEPDELDEPDELLLDPDPEPELDPDPDPELDPDPDPELVLDPELLPPEPELDAPELDPVAAPLLDPVSICAAVEAGGGLDVPPYGPPRGASEPPHAAASKAAPITPCFPRDPSKCIAELPLPSRNSSITRDTREQSVEAGHEPVSFGVLGSFQGASSMAACCACQRERKTIRPLSASTMAMVLASSTSKTTFCGARPACGGRVPRAGPVGWTSTSAPSTLATASGTSR